MELRITNPQENWLTEQILWNNEELKTAIAEKVKDYKTIAYTEDSLKDMKADRADLNKLKKAFEDERKRVKKICMEPYTKFEQQVKEITALIDEPIGLIDSQIKEIDERRKAAKREEIPEKDMWKYSSFWFKDFDGMALKTMLRQLISKWGIMSIDLQNAIDKDMAVIHEDGKTDYVDAAKAEDDGVVSDQELQEVQEDQPAAPGTQQPDPKGIEASFFG